MSLMLDPRAAYLLNPLLCDSAAIALLQQSALGNSETQHNGGGKMGPSSFRILDILDSSNASEKANTSGENDSLDEESESGRPSARSPLLSSHHGGKKARKARTIFTDKQLQELESMFEKHKYLSVQDRMDLAHRMNLTDTQVKTWYQNRRTKWKRQAAVGVDLLQEPSNFAVIQNLLRTNPYWVQQYMSNPAMFPFAQRLLPSFPQSPSASPTIPSSTPNPFPLIFPPNPLNLSANRQTPDRSPTPPKTVIENSSEAASPSPTAAL